MACIAAFQGSIGRVRFFLIFSCQFNGEKIESTETPKSRWLSTGKSSVVHSLGVGTITNFQKETNVRKKQSIRLVSTRCYGIERSGGDGRTEADKNEFSNPFFLFLVWLKGGDIFGLFCATFCYDSHTIFWSKKGPVIRVIPPLSLHHGGTAYPPLLQRAGPYRR